MEDKLDKLREKWVKSPKWRRVVIEAEAKEIKNGAKVHEHKASMKSHKSGNYYIFICNCDEELGREIRS